MSIDRNDKKAIFIPEEIYKTKPVRYKQKPMHSFVDDNGEYNMYTTGNLERAVQAGYEIYVCLDAPLSIHDDWWVNKIKGFKNILEPDILFAYIPEEPLWDEGTPNPESYPRMPKIVIGGFDCPILLGVWRRLYDMLGIEWFNNIKTWDEARAILALDFKMGSEFS